MQWKRNLFREIVYQENVHTKRKMQIDHHLIAWQIKNIKEREREIRDLGHNFWRYSNIMMPKLHNIEWASNSNKAFPYCIFTSQRNYWRFVVRSTTKANYVYTNKMIKKCTSVYSTLKMFHFISIVSIFRFYSMFRAISFSLLCTREFCFVLVLLKYRKAPFLFILRRNSPDISCSIFEHTHHIILSNDLYPKWIFVLHKIIVRNFENETFGKSHEWSNI